MRELNYELNTPIICNSITLVVSGIGQNCETEWQLIKIVLEDNNGTYFLKGKYEVVTLDTKVFLDTDYMGHIRVFSRKENGLKITVTKDGVIIGCN